MNSALWLLLWRGGTGVTPVVPAWPLWLTFSEAYEGMIKNQAGQKVTLLAIDASTGAPKTGDAANITFYVKKDGGSVTALTDTSATEDDSTNAKGSYTCDVTQTETNADWLEFTGKSSTSGVYIVPKTVYTRSDTSGHGAYSCTWTVNDGSTALENATVRFTEATSTFTATTNASGQGTMSLDAATYTVSIYKAGYTFTPTTHVVSSTSSTWTATFSMTQVSITPDPDPAKSVVQVTCYGADTLVEEGVSIWVQQIGLPPNDSDHVFDSTITEYTSNSSGIVTLTLWKNALYQIRRGNSGWVQYKPNNDVDSISSFFGRDVG